MKTLLRESFQILMIRSDRSGGEGVVASQGKSLQLAHPYKYIKAPKIAIAATTNGPGTYGLLLPTCDICCLFICQQDHGVFWKCMD